MSEFTVRFEFTARFDTDNDAFQPEPGPEIARILRDIAARMGGGADASKALNIRDVNGNTIGTFKLREED